MFPGALCAVDVKSITYKVYIPGALCALDAVATPIRARDGRYAYVGSARSIVVIQVVHTLSFVPYASFVSTIVDILYSYLRPAGLGGLAHARTFWAPPCTLIPCPLRPCTLILGQMVLGGGGYTRAPAQEDYRSGGQAARLAKDPDRRAHAAAGMAVYCIA